MDHRRDSVRLEIFLQLISLFALDHVEVIDVVCVRHFCRSFDLRNAGEEFVVEFRSFAALSVPCFKMRKFG